MSDTPEAVWARLRALDDAGRVERPADFDDAEATTRFHALVKHVELTFSCTCRVDAGFPSVQDASHYGDLTVPADATESGVPIVIRVSNFGRLALYAAEGLASWTEAEREELLTATDTGRIEDALTATGHFIVPEDILDTDYDGPCDFWRRHFPNERPPTWRTRFFDYV